MPPVPSQAGSGPWNAEPPAPKPVVAAVPDPKPPPPPAVAPKPVLPVVPEPNPPPVLLPKSPPPVLVFAPKLDVAGVVVLPNPVFPKEEAPVFELPKPPPVVPAVFVAPKALGRFPPPNMEPVWFAVLLPKPRRARC